MNGFRWTRYLLMILGVSVLVALVAKFITANALVLIPLSVGLGLLLFNRYVRQDAEP